MLVTYQNLVEKILDELLLQRPGGEQTVKIGSEQLSDEVTVRVSERSRSNRVCNLHVLQWGDEDITQTDDLLCGQNPSSLHLLCCLVSIRSHASGA